MSHITVAADSSQTLRSTVHSRSDYTPVQQLQIQMIQNHIILQQLHYFQAFKRDIWIYSKSKLTVSFDCIIQKNTSNRSLHSFNNWICSFLNIVHLQLYYDGRLDPSWRGGRLSWQFLPSLSFAAGVVSLYLSHWNTAKVCCWIHIRRNTLTDYTFHFIHLDKLLCNSVHVLWIVIMLEYSSSPRLLESSRRPCLWCPL